MVAAGEVRPADRTLEQDVANLGEAPKAWTNGGAKGSETSGAWAQDGYTVILKSRNGVELARRTMTTVACPD